MRQVFRIKRIYDKSFKNDGCRILVDGLWPRGLKKEEVHIEAWEKSLAPSKELRKWFGHDPALWTGFQRKYLAELKRNKNVDLFLDKYFNEKIVTLLYAAKDDEHNNAIVLKKYLDERVNEV